MKIRKFLHTIFLACMFMFSGAALAADVATSSLGTDSFTAPLIVKAHAQTAADISGLASPDSLSLLGAIDGTVSIEKVASITVDMTEPPSQTRSYGCSTGCSTGCSVGCSTGCSVGCR